MDNLPQSLFFLDPNVGWVLVGMVCMCTGAAIVGVFMFLQKRALIGDTISHAILPGICLAFLIMQSKNILYLLTGAIGTGLLGLTSVNYITAKTRIKPDAALGIVLSVFYGIGILLLTFIQQSGNAAQSGLDKFLFGKAAAMVRADVITFAIFTSILVLMIIIWYRPLKLVTFDRDFALVKGLPVKRLEGMLSFMTVIAIAIGIQAIGVVLMAALLIAPVVAARYWTHNLQLLILLSVVFASISGIAGAYISYTLPRMPTGPWVVIVLALFALISILLGTSKGIVVRWYNQLQYKRKILKENILKCLYQLGEQDGDFYLPRRLDTIQNRRYIPTIDLKRGSRLLEKKGLVTYDTHQVGFTEEGLEEGKRIVRIHRLWELYLTTHLDLPADHVHDNAEAIEHVITPEIEQALGDTLSFPNKDPHASPIPYSRRASQTNKSSS